MVLGESDTNSHLLQVIGTYVSLGGNCYRIVIENVIVYLYCGIIATKNSDKNIAFIFSHCLDLQNNSNNCHSKTQIHLR